VRDRGHPVGDRGAERLEVGGDVGRLAPQSVEFGSRPVDGGRRVVRQNAPDGRLVLVDHQRHLRPLALGREKHRVRGPGRRGGVEPVGRRHLRQEVRILALEDGEEVRVEDGLGLDGAGDDGSVPAPQQVRVHQRRQVGPDDVGPVDAVGDRLQRPDWYLQLGEDGARVHEHLDRGRVGPGNGRHQVVGVEDRPRSGLVPPVLAGGHHARQGWGVAVAALLDEIGLAELPECPRDRPPGVVERLHDVAGR